MYNDNFTEKNFEEPFVMRIFARIVSLVVEALQWAFLLAC